MHSDSTPPSPIRPSTLGPTWASTRELVSDLTFDELRELPQGVTLGMDLDASPFTEKGL